MNYTEKAEYYVQQMFPCGCEVRHYRDDSYGITYCPKHMAAPEMYKALKAVDKLFQNIPIEIEYQNLFKEIPLVKQALAKAEGVENEHSTKA